MASAGYAENHHLFELKRPPTSGHVTSKHNPKEMRIGEYLVEAELIDVGDLRHAAQLARTSNMAIGQVLVMSGLVTKLDLVNAVKVQSMVRDFKVPLKLGIKGLALSNKEEIPIDEALTMLGWTESKEIPTNKLGELLVMAGVINNENLETAIRSASTTGVPLGRVLVSLNLISEEMLAATLNAQLLVRDGRLSREQAVKGMKATFTRMTAIGDMIARQGFVRSGPVRTIRLGQLLAEANLISDIQLWEACALNLLEGKPLSEILQRQRVLGQHILLTALKVQEMVANQTLLTTDAAPVLKLIDNHRTSLEAALACIEIPEKDLKTSVRFHELLKLAELISNQVIDDLQFEKNSKPGYPDAISCATTLATKGLLSEHLCEGALRCYYLLACGWLNMQRAVIALNYFKDRTISFDDCLYELRWTIRTFIRDETVGAVQK